MNHAVPLPTLRGTPKQVEWAERIRSEAAPIVAEWIAELADFVPRTRYEAKYSLLPRQRLDLVCALRCNSAKFWIDARNAQTPEEFIRIWERPRA